MPHHNWIKQNYIFLHSVQQISYSQLKKTECITNLWSMSQINVTSSYRQYSPITHKQMQTSKIRFLQLKNKKPTRCHLLYLLYFLDTQHVSALICPSSGVCDYVVVLPQWLYCSWIAVCWS